MRAAAIAILALGCIVAANAKIVSVGGNVRQMGVPGLPLPPNVFSDPSFAGTDASSPVESGNLLIGVFDEKQGISPLAPVTLSNGVELSPSKVYDSLFIYFHQPQTTTTQRSATGTITTDNRIVGCTSNGAADEEVTNGSIEIATTPRFGLESVDYQTTTQAARGVDDDDFAEGAGSVVNLDFTIRQPGDYTRCFSEVCGDSCTCTASYHSPSCLVGTAPICYASAQALIDASVPVFQFSSTCSVTAASVVPTLKASSCSESAGCTLNSDDSFCLDPTKAHHLEFSLTAGCNCGGLETVAFDILPCGSGCPSLTLDDQGHGQTAGVCGCFDVPPSLY